MAAHPGIVFRDGPSGRRAALARGPDVWEVIALLASLDVGGDAALEEASEWLALPKSLIRTALAYHSDFAAEIDAEIEANDRAAREARESLEARKSADFETTMRHLRELTCEHLAEPHHRWWAPHVWSAVVVRYDAPVLAVLREWLRSPDARQIETVSALVSEAPRKFVWREEPFVVELLNAAAGNGGERLRRARNDLWRSVTSGVRGRHPGEPAAEDLDQRDRSREVAARLPVGSVGQRFYRDLARSAEETIRRHAAWDEELVVVPRTTPSSTTPPTTAPPASG